MNMMTKQYKTGDEVVLESTVTDSSTTRGKLYEALVLVNNHDTMSFNFKGDQGKWRQVELNSLTITTGKLLIKEDKPTLKEGNVMTKQYKAGDKVTLVCNVEGIYGVTSGIEYDGVFRSSCIGDNIFIHFLDDNGVAFQFTPASHHIVSGAITIKEDKPTLKEGVEYTVTLDFGLDIDALEKAGVQGISLKGILGMTPSEMRKYQSGEHKGRFTSEGLVSALPHFFHADYIKSFKEVPKCTPKYTPKKGDAVYVWNDFGVKCGGAVGVFNHMLDGEYRIYDTVRREYGSGAWPNCEPLDITKL